MLVNPENMYSYKLSTLFTIALLLSLALTYAAVLPEPAPTRGESLATTRYGDAEARNLEVDESCEVGGAKGKEECLMRRTLAAHLDYIYTQKNKP
ncbi:phytosulfokines-like [Juglans regia]|uniref:Phytosulfokine n=1 Tax=Juglans regia TaxID=51240 RepID=A0A6P9ELK6_JUGRE|nr:phytosulfokines-like [Juglans regia]